MMLPHLDLPLTDVTWHVNVTFGVGAINVDDEPALRKPAAGRLCDTSTVSTRHTGVHRIDGQDLKITMLDYTTICLLYISNRLQLLIDGTYD